MNRITLLMLVTVCLLLAACGFKLRGYIPLSAELQTIYIDTDDLRLKEQLTRSFKGSKANVVTRPIKGAAVLKVYQSKLDRAIRSISGRGRVREYSLSYTVQFDIKHNGKVLLAKQIIVVKRDYSFNETEVLGKAVEENIISEELRREMVPQILNRVRSITKK